MPESFVGVPPDSTGKKLRSRQRTVGTNTVDEQYFIETPERVATFTGTAGLPLTAGNAATPQNLCSIGNASGSGLSVAVRLLEVATVSTAASTVRNPNYHLSRITTAPTGGTAMTKQGMRSTETSHANVSILAAVAADGGSATAISATAGGIATRMRNGYSSRLHTLAGTDFGPAITLIGTAGAPVELAAGEFLLLQVVAAAAADNIAGRFFAINVVWEEFTRP